MEIRKISIEASSYEGEKKLPSRFLKVLQSVLDNGGSIVNITQDQTRRKEAFVLVTDGTDIDYFKWC